LEGALEDIGGRLPFRRLSFVRNPRQIHFGRAGLVILVALIVLIAVIYLGDQATRSAFGWLHHQSQYQYPFQEIQLIPEPPPWFRGGRPAFLKGVRREAREAENIPMLDLTPEQLADEFRHYAWVRQVEKVFYPPSGIIVHLRYRQPVAYVEFPPADRKLLDETGTILSIDDVDRVQLGDLIKISGAGLVAPSDPRVGVIWKSRPEGSDRDEPDRRILAATKLAGFLSQPARVGDASRSPALRMIEIDVTEFHPHGGVFLKNAEDAWIWWKEAPGDERPGRPTAAEKWAMLQRWRESSDHRPLPQGDYLAFDGTQIRHHQDQKKKDEE
jgi:hypothetical protein